MFNPGDSGGAGGGVFQLPRIFVRETIGVIENLQLGRRFPLRPDNEHPSDVGPQHNAYYADHGTVEYVCKKVSKKLINSWAITPKRNTSGGGLRHHLGYLAPRPKVRRTY